MPPMELSKTITSNVVPEGAITAGAPTTLAFSYKDTAGAAVSDFEVTHERLLHVFIVREDLATYAHEHPDTKPDGTSSMAYTFPTPGKYRVYSDFRSKAHGANVTVSEVVVPGEAPPPVPLEADDAEILNGDLLVRLGATPKPFKAGAATTLTYVISDQAGDVTDLEPYLGAMGHLFVLGQDLVTMAHSHHPEEHGQGADRNVYGNLPEARKVQALGSVPARRKNRHDLRCDRGALAHCAGAVRRSTRAPLTSHTMRRPSASNVMAPRLPAGTIDDRSIQSMGVACSARCRARTRRSWTS